MSPETYLGIATRYRDDKVQFEYAKKRFYPAVAAMAKTDKRRADELLEKLAKLTKLRN
jgi:hypothetical protein